MKLQVPGQEQVPGVRCQVLVCGLLLCAFAATGQVAKQANEGYKTLEGRDSVAKSLSAADLDRTQLATSDQPDLTPFSGPLVMRVWGRVQHAIGGRMLLGFGS